jgi:hypothetical protein
MRYAVRRRIVAAVGLSRVMGQPDMGFLLLAVKNLSADFADFRRFYE